MSAKKFVLDNKEYSFFENECFEPKISKKLFKNIPQLPENYKLYELENGVVLNDHKVIKGSDQILLFKYYNYLKYKTHKHIISGHKTRARKTLEEALEIRNGLICSNTRLAVNISSQFYSRQFVSIIPFDLAISQANVTLIKCVEFFDPFRGFQFSTYAANSIKKELYRELEKATKVDLLQEDAEVEIVDYRANELREETKQKEIKQFLNIILQNLSEDKRELIKARYGFYGESKTLQNIADERSLSKERIRQIQKDVMEEISKFININKLHKIGNSLCA